MPQPGFPSLSAECGDPKSIILFVQFTKVNLENSTLERCFLMQDFEDSESSLWTTTLTVDCESVVKASKLAAKPRLDGAWAWT